MALISCPECGKEISDTCKECLYCGFKLPRHRNTPKKDKKTEERKKKYAIILVILILILALGIYFYAISPKTVEWFCKHDISLATCTESEKCSRCDKVFGESMGHMWQNATCTEPKTCSVCKVTEGKEMGHDWWVASCTKPQTCRRCGETEGKPTKHNIVNYVCSHCGEVFIDKDNVGNILDITSFKYDVDFVGGVDVYMTFNNKSSSKTINYITMTLEFYNAVGDVLKDRITDGTKAIIEYTGPLKAGETSGEVYWRACFYNSTFSGSFAIKEIKIEYSNGTTIVLDENVAPFVVVGWR